MNARTLILAVALGLSAPQIALAGDSIQTLNIASLDEIFSEAAGIDSTLTSAQKDRKSARKNVNEILGLQPKTAFSDSLAELKDRAGGKIQVAMNGSVPTLAATDAVPSDVQSAIDAVNAAVSTYSSLLTDLRDVPQQSKAAAKKTKNLKVSDLRSEMGAFSISEISTRIDQVRTFKTNLEVTAALPGKANTLVQNLGADVQAVTDVFPSR